MMLISIHRYLLSRCATGVEASQGKNSAMQSSMNTIHRYLTCTTYPVILSTDWSKEKNKGGELEDRRQCPERESKTGRRSLALHVAEDDEAIIAKTMLNNKGCRGYILNSLPAIR